MGPRGIVELQPLFGHLPDLRQRREDQGIEDFVAVRRVEVL